MLHVRFNHRSERLLVSSTKEEVQKIQVAKILKRQVWILNTSEGEGQAMQGEIEHVLFEIKYYILRRTTCSPSSLLNFAMKL